MTQYEDRIDLGPNILREIMLEKLAIANYQGKNRNLALPWEELPDHRKEQWRNGARAVLLAATKLGLVVVIQDRVAA
jgi:hypothetical protein